MSLFAYCTLGILGYSYYVWRTKQLKIFDLLLLIALIYIQLFYIIGWSLKQFILLGVGLTVLIYLMYNFERVVHWFCIKRVFIISISMCLVLLIVTEFFNGIWYFTDHSEFFIIHRQVKENTNKFPFKIQRIVTTLYSDDLYIFTFENITVLFPIPIKIQEGELYWARQYSMDRDPVWMKYGKEADPYDY